MLLEKLLSQSVQQFIIENTGKPVTQLALQKNPFPDVEWTEIVGQIAAREKAKDKLPTWFTTADILYPGKISVEQTSSESTARYKSTLVSGENLIDLTGGFGIDDYYFAQRLGNVTHCELNLHLSSIVKHNYEILGVTNVQCIPGDSLTTLETLQKKWDLIYIDPSRRSDAKGKVFLLKDCMPNVPELLDTYFKYSHNLLIKTAPILDISAGLAELHSVKEIQVIALNNEVKELLWIIEKGFAGTPTLTAVNLTKDGEDIFTASYEPADEAPYGLPKKYLYEPNAAIMKSGAFDAVAHHYAITKLHKHTQLYTSDELIPFAGRRFTIDAIIPYQKAEMKPLEGSKMNITTRNFPLNVEDIRKKWKIKDGGDIYAFFTTNSKNEKVVLVCSKI
ncbi:class I SAM-dependent methyltransferase [Flavobacterium sp. DG1-102-2]|uniref:THUMP-like domain-containing protein n=1 Tax=Flavobacterium sp. DG1-102-2 TaxID=3081663 RepID=UPI002948E004|nr:class I SAM-dependent methyltransferase [Flavobacterium sp. DG1-102-2]MDV6166809.1 class I SAM-dependent methyltransferase [Flavobacterium sp. DG1-102-2]